MTITHLLACSGRAEELKQLMDVLFRMQGDGVETIRRWVTSGCAEAACKHTCCPGSTCCCCEIMRRLHWCGAAAVAAAAAHLLLRKGSCPALLNIAHIQHLCCYNQLYQLAGNPLAGTQRATRVCALTVVPSPPSALLHLYCMQPQQCILYIRPNLSNLAMACRIVLESRNNDACKGKNCELLADRPGLYAHGTLHFNSPPQQVVLFGDVTPFECAAAHGHIQAMKLLVQVCVALWVAAGTAGGAGRDCRLVWMLRDELGAGPHLQCSKCLLAGHVHYLSCVEQGSCPVVKVSFV